MSRTNDRYLATARLAVTARILHLLTLAACFALFSPRSLRAFEQNGTWLLRLREESERIVLDRATWSKAIKTLASDASSPWRYELRNRGGAMLAMGALDIRDNSHVEMFAPNGELHRVPNSDTSRLFAIRIPAFVGGGIVTLFRNNSEAPEAPSRLGEFELPEPGESLQAAATETSGELITLSETGPRSGRVNIVVLGDGFTTSERGAFTNQAQLAVQAYLTTPPLSSYASFFNAYAIYTASVESGSDHPSKGIFRNTYFNSTYDSYGTSYLVTIPPNTQDSNPENGQLKVFALLAQHVPEYDIALVVVNDTAYGGSGGVPAIVSVNAQSSQILVHELGHSFAHLGDEYGTPYPGYPETEEPNTTKETRRDFVKWRAWINASTPVPTPQTSPYASVVGLFEGAHYHDTGWFRPKLDCKMRTLGKPYCEVCAQAVVLSIHGAAQTVQNPTPAASHVVLNDDPTTFSLSLLPAQGLTYQVQWKLNGIDLPGASGGFVSLGRAQLNFGLNRLDAIVSASSAFVRTDTVGRLISTNTWTLEPASIQDLRLLNPQMGPAGNLTFQVNRSVDPAVVEVAEDLRSWTPVTTSAFSPGVTFTVPRQGVQHAFIRLVAP